MILRELFEVRAKTKSVGIIFGRFNPPHMGHIKAWEMASENTSWYVGTNKDTQGPKDPLPFNVKIEVMKTMYPDLEGHLVAEISWLTLASKVYEKHGNIVLNVYTDEDWVTKALLQYNGKEGAHGYYEFGTIQQQVTPRLSSATALRAAVAADDRAAFSKAAGVDADTSIAGHAFFDVVKHYLTPYAEKAAAKLVKKKVKQPEQDMAEGWSDAVVARRTGTPRTPYSVFIKGKKWKDFENDDHAEAVANKLRAKFKADGRDPGVITVAPTDMSEGIMGFLSQEKPKVKKSASLSAMRKEFEKEKSSEQPDYIQSKDIPKNPQHVKTVRAENAWDRLQRERALESAGVGIITKQNTTVDVNKNTPRKNLKAFRLI